MKKLLLLIGLVVLLSPVVYAGEYDGEWQKKSVSNDCSNFFNWDKSILIIKNNMVSYNLSNTNGWAHKFKGRISKSKIGINSNLATLTGKINNNKISMKFSNILESWEWEKMLSKCTLEFVRVDQKKQDTQTTLVQSQLPKCKISNNRYKIIGYIYPFSFNNLLTSELRNKIRRTGSTFSKKEINQIKKAIDNEDRKMSNIFDSRFKTEFKTKLVPGVKTNTACYAEIIIDAGMYKGEFLNGKPDGWGKLELAIRGDKYEGNFKNGFFEGKGEYYFYNGNKYVGEFKRGYNQIVKGIKTFADGRKYDGYFKTDWYITAIQFHGDGTLTYPNGDKFIGKFIEGYRLNGTYYYSNGDIYTGSYESNKKHGQGIYTYAGGKSFRSRWEHGILIGEEYANVELEFELKSLEPTNKKYVYCKRGYSYYKLNRESCPDKFLKITENEYLNKQKKSNTTKVAKQKPEKTTTTVVQSQLLKCKIDENIIKTQKLCYGKIERSGAIYEGEFEFGQLNGQGSLIYIRGTASYVGEWKDGEKHGYGTYKRPSDTYVGEWKNNKRHGQGTVTNRSGRTYYIGEWKNDYKHGLGIYTYYNGDIYTGEFKNNSRNGQGTLTYVDGKIESGLWKRNKLVKKSDTTVIVKVEPKTTTTKKKTEQTVTVEKDITGPEIIVKDTFTADANLTATIKGRVEDDSEIVTLTIDGDQVTLTNGAFTQSLYVLEDKEVIIAAIDKFGNRSDKIVLLNRGQVQAVAAKFEPLDPRRIKSKINNNAVALIIGVEDYENTYEAAYAKQDALYFNDFAHQAFGVPRQSIRMLTNADAERNDTLRVMSNWLPQIIKEDKTDFYLFYAGHGLASSDGEDLFLLPHDGYPDALEVTALLRSDIFTRIAGLNPRSVTVFLDTCYSGATRSNDALRATRDLVIVEEQTIPENFTVFSASANNEVANVLKEAGHGLFSYFLMKGLEGDADGNNDQRITTNELHAFINYHVNRQAKQSPQLSGDDNRVLVEW